MKKILIIEDDFALAKGLSIFLKEEGFETTIANDGIDGYEIASKSYFDLIILDLILPKKSGIEVCRDLRNLDINVPIIILSSRNEETDKVVGLELGADDYVTKPFSNKELSARIRAVLRRFEGEKKIAEEFSFGCILINFTNHEVNKNDEPIKLSETEFKILKYFIEHEGEVISRNMLLDDVWGYEAFPTTRTVDNYILSLRKKIEDNPSQPKYLQTIHTAGYKFKSSG